MITEATQLVIIHEWSNNTMNADLAKTLLQGRWMVTAIKHSQPRCVNCYSPFYITTNKLPDFRTENEDVERRIQIFHTTSLPVTLRNVDRWIYDNAMHSIAWMADEINENRDFIDPEELWYEEDADNRLTSSQISQAQWACTEMLQITDANLEPVNTHPNTSNTKDTIHVEFVTKARSRRLSTVHEEGCQFTGMRSWQRSATGSCAFLYRARSSSQIDADPEIDAWMLAMGRKREIFDIKAFVDMSQTSSPT